MRTADPQYTLLEKRQVGPGTWVLRFERLGLKFEPGQHLSVSPPGARDFREYSIYSGVEDDYLEILVKEVDQGRISRQLVRTEVGQKLAVWGPIGFFTLPPEAAGHPLTFLATGTGISPFHCFAASRPDLDYLLVHGIRTPEEAYEGHFYPKERYIRCVSRATGGEYSGRVTAWLEQSDLDPEGYFFLCGNCDMIYDAFDLLKSRGIPSRQIYSEVYF